MAAHHYSSNRTHVGTLKKSLLINCEECAKLFYNEWRVDILSTIGRIAARWLCEL